MLSTALGQHTSHDRQTRATWQVVFVFKVLPGVWFSNAIHGARAFCFDLVGILLGWIRQVLFYTPFLRTESETG